MRQKIMQLNRKLAALYLKPESLPSEFIAISQRLAELRIINQTFAIGTKQAYEAIAQARVR